MSNIRIAVGDDHPLFREGVIRSLAECPGLEIVAEGATRDEAVAIAARIAPDIMLMDISMPGSGLQVMLTVSEAGDDLALALKHGAKGYVLKGVGSQALAEVVRTVASGETYVAPGLSARLVETLSRVEEKHPLAALTQREQDVLNLVASGLSNKRIAIALDLHEKTIKHHMTRIFSKLGVTNRTEAALALRDAAAHTPSAAERPQPSPI